MGIRAQICMVVGLFLSYTIFMKISALKAEIDIISSSYNFHLILVLVLLLQKDGRTDGRKDGR
jgi:nitrogen fixation/metabolism regulation signal transduction histidine kinase